MIELSDADEAVVAPIREALRAPEKQRTVRFPADEAPPESAEEPALADRANKLKGWDAEGRSTAVDLATQLIGNATPATYRGTFSGLREAFGSTVFEAADPADFPPGGMEMDPAFPCFRAPVDTLPEEWEGPPITHYWIYRFLYSNYWYLDYTTDGAVRESFGAPKMDGSSTPGGAYGDDFVLAVETEGGGTAGILKVMTADDAAAGTSDEPMIVSPKVLHDEIARQISAIQP